MSDTARQHSGPDREMLAELELRIAELDALAEESAEASASRRVLLILLEQYGFFDPGLQPAMRRALWQSGFERVAEVRAAAQALTEYLVSPQRSARFARSGPPPPAAHAGVSIDWFRRPGARPRLFADALVWTAWCEAWLASSAVSQRAGRGEVWARVNDERWVIHWRAEDGITPALVRAGILRAR
jgi:hypothetical protein